MSWVLRTGKYSPSPSLQGAEKHVKKNITPVAQVSSPADMQLSLHLPQGQQTQPAQTRNPTPGEGNQASVDSSHEGYLSAAQLTHSSPRKSSWGKPKKPEIHLWNKDSRGTWQFSPLDTANCCCSIFPTQVHPWHPQNEAEVQLPGSALAP